VGLGWGEVGPGWVVMDGVGVWVDICELKEVEWGISLG